MTLALIPEPQGPLCFDIWGQDIPEAMLGVKALNKGYQRTKCDHCNYGHSFVGSKQLKGVGAYRLQVYLIKTLWLM